MYSDDTTLVAGDVGADLTVSRSDGTPDDTTTSTFTDARDDVLGPSRTIYVDYHFSVIEHYRGVTPAPTWTPSDTTTETVSMGPHTLVSQTMNVMNFQLQTLGFISANNGPTIDEGYIPESENTDVEAAWTLVGPAGLEYWTLDYDFVRFDDALDPDTDLEDTSWSGLFNQFGQDAVDGFYPCSRCGEYMKDHGTTSWIPAFPYCDGHAWRYNFTTEQYEPSRRYAPRTTTDWDRLLDRMSKYMRRWQSCVHIGATLVPRYGGGL